MNAAYSDIYSNRPSQLQFLCVKNAIDGNPVIGSDIPDNYQKTIQQKSQAESAVDEIATDMDPRTQTRRQMIFDEFKAWGRSKGWVDQNGNIQCP